MKVLHRNINLLIIVGINWKENKLWTVKKKAAILTDLEQAKTRIKVKNMA